MNLLVEPNTPLWLSASLLAALLLLPALYFAPWRAWRSVASRQHAWYGAILALAVFWMMNANVRELMLVHPLVMTALTLTFGWAFASIGGPLALLINATLMGRLGLSFPVDLLISVLIPILVSQLFLHLLERIRYRNLFIYMLGGGFFGAMIALLASTGFAWLLFTLTGSAELVALFNEHAYLLVMLLFPEGFINGMVVTVTTVFYPNLMRSFDDHAYLDQDQNNDQQ